MGLRYITDDKGEKQAVVLPIGEYDDLLDDLQDLAVVAERRDEETLTHQRVLEELELEGLA